jgi:hypothetical protein
MPGSQRNRGSRLPPPDPGELAPAPPVEPGYRIAVEPLYVGAARAHVPGDRVPLDSVTRNGWETWVVMPPPDPGPHTAKDGSAAAEVSDVDSVGGDGEPGRPSRA